MTDSQTAAVEGTKTLGCPMVEFVVQFDSGGQAAVISQETNYAANPETGEWCRLGASSEIGRCPNPVLPKVPPAAASKPPRRPRVYRPFIKPTPQEVEDYAQKIGYQIEGDTFCEFYEANDWRTTEDKPIKNWKMAVVTWVKTAKRKGNHWNSGVVAIDPGKSFSSVDNMEYPFKNILDSAVKAQMQLMLKTIEKTAGRTLVESEITQMLTTYFDLRKWVFNLRGRYGKRVGGNILWLGKPDTPAALYGCHLAFMSFFKKYAEWIEVNYKNFTMLDTRNIGVRSKMFSKFVGHLSRIHNLKFDTGRKRTLNQLME